MMRNGKRPTIMKHLEHTTKIGYDFAVANFGSVTAIDVAEDHCEWFLVDGYDDVRRFASEKKWQLLVPSVFYDQKVKDHGDDPTWILHDVTTWVLLRVISEEYYQLYIDGLAYRFDGDPAHPNPMQVLQSGDMRLVVHAHMDGNNYLWDVDGKIIPHAIPLDYITIRLTSKNYLLKNLKKHLKEQPGVSKLKVIEIPDYNAEVPDEKAIKFSYMPQSQEEAEELAKPGSTERAHWIRQKLGTDAFRKTPEEDPDD